MTSINKHSSREEVLKVVKADGWTLEHASDELKNDREVVLEAVMKDAEAPEFFGQCSLAYASTSLRADREVVLESVKENGLALEFASDDLRNNRKIVFKAIANTHWALRFASDELKADPELIKISKQ